MAIHANRTLTKVYSTDQEILLDQIRQNTQDIEINLGDADVNFEAMEILLAAGNADLAALEVLGNTNGTTLSKIHGIALLGKGDPGSVTIAGNAAQAVSAGTYWAVNFISATTPTVLVLGNSTAVVDVEYPAGTWIYGDVRNITGDSSGLYILYKGNPI